MEFHLDCLSLWKIQVFHPPQPCWAGALCISVFLGAAPAPGSSSRLQQELNSGCACRYPRSQIPCFQQQIRTFQAEMGRGRRKKLILGHLSSCHLSFFFYDLQSLGSVFLPRRIPWNFPIQPLPIQAGEVTGAFPEYPKYSPPAPHLSRPFLPHFS